jgi:hypothetical protein
MRTRKGWEQIFGTPGVAPHFALPVVTSAQVFWIYTSLAKAYVWDGAAHTNITRQSAAVDVNYTATSTRDWNGTLLGGIPILNNGSDVPQYWSSLSPSTKLADLTNWPVGGKAAVLRAFGAYLVAANYTIGGVNYPHLVKWSASVDGPGQLPGSWDETDPANDAGEYDLPDVNSGLLREMMSLGAKLFLYKDQSIWSMRYVGGRPIFAFEVFTDTLGILAPRCVAITGDGKKHVVATQNDIIIHNGSADPVSILNKKMRKTVYNDMDTVNYINSFMFADYENNEIIFAYPQAGRENPNRGLVFNYRNGSLTECSIAFRNAASGKVETASTDIWDTGSDVWDTDVGPWSLQERRKIVLCDPDNTKFHQWASGYTQNGVGYACTLQRIGFSIVGRKRTGEWIVDHEVMKFVDRLWPKVQGGPIKIRIGTQMLVNGPVTWGPYVDFDPATGVTADFAMSGRAIALEFTTPTALDWRIDGFKLSVAADGNF